MKAFALSMVLLSLALPFAAGQDTVLVTLQANLGTASAPLLVDCQVRVPQESNVGDVLDQAREDGCIREWSSSSYPGLGRYVTSINHVQAAVVTYWAFRLNGDYATTGIDATIVMEGDVYKFTYEQWPVPL